MPGPVFLRGDRVTLRPVEPEDRDFLAGLWNHPDVRPGFGWTQPRSTDAAADRIEAFTESDDRELLLTCADGRPVGTAFLFDIHSVRGRAELGYAVHPDEQGNGYATAAAELLVDYALTERRLHKVVARALEFNDASKSVLETLGFQQEGRQRDEFYVDGEYVDAVRYGLLDDEWRD